MPDTKLKQQAFPNKDERKLAALEAQKAKEKMFKLVVKIISWESGSLESNVIQTVDKITPAEWLKYKKHRLGIPTTLDKEKAKEKLDETYNAIKTNGGFE